MYTSYLGMPFHSLNGEIDYIFDQLERYLDQTEEALQSLKIAENEYFKKQLSQFPMLELFDDQHLDCYEKVIPRNNRYSFLVLVFITFETYMNLLCEYICIRWRLQTKPDNNRDNIKSWKKYLKEIVGVPDLDWGKVEDFAKVRNCIVHMMGKVPQTHKHSAHLTMLCNQSVGISLSKSESRFRVPELIIGMEYCKLVIDALQSLLLKIADSLEDTERKWEEANVSDAYDESDDVDFERP
jgi:hypothetical protein